MEKTSIFSDFGLILTQRGQGPEQIFRLRKDGILKIG